MITWNTFKINMKDYLINSKAKSNTDFAEYLSNQYNSVISTSMTSTSLPILPITQNPTIFSNAIISSFNTQFNSESLIGLPTYIEIGNGLLNYWKQIMYVSSTILYFGNIQIISVDLLNTFTKNKNETDINIAVENIVNDLVLTFTKHLSTISGTSIISGNPVPFIGIK